MPIRSRALLTAVTVLALAACSGSGQPDGGPRTGKTLAWTAVELPAGEEPVVLTPIGTDLLVGLRRPAARVKPHLLRLTAAGTSTEIPVHPNPSSPYAYEARWNSLVTDGTRILAIGGAPGGAHSNTRWTTWTGTTAGLTEKPQSFNTFGGWGAGQLVDAVMTPAGTALVGSWGSAKAGLDGAVWLPSGDRWVRQSSAGTALESTQALQVNPRAGTTSGDAIVLTGSQLRLAPGLVEQHAALWRSAKLNQGWTRLELPEGGKRSEGVESRCTTTTCMVAGYADDKVALWRVEGTNATRLANVPDIAVSDRDVVPAPFDVNGRLVQLVAS
ncbi:MAG TPA: hypothetical protein VEK80_05575, partial [Kribbellaceae bacterium]|nr:hypothetical protein [Kribbellaceae bacterium]